jgi:nitroreductase
MQPSAEILGAACKKICICEKYFIPLHRQTENTAMDTFLSLCQHRRSIRKYTSQPVEQEKIDYLLRCALMSPSSKRTNPWEFIVIRDEVTLRALSGARTYGSAMFQTATAAIVVALDSSLSDTWMADGAIAAEHLLLAAEEQGLGACWCQIYNREGAEELVKSLCGVPEDRIVLCVISLGYKDEERKTYDLDKLPYGKIHEERY